MNYNLDVEVKYKTIEEELIEKLDNNNQRRSVSNLR